MFGGEVNQTKSGEVGSTEAERNLCTAASGDVCKIGVSGTGNGQFGSWAIGSFIAIDSSGALDEIYVGDQDRIQEFDTQGNYVDNVALPEPGVVGALAVDQQSGDLYFSYASAVAPFPNPSGECEQPNVHRMDPATGEEVDELEVDCPGAIAVDEEGKVYVFGKTVFVTNGHPGNHPARILEFDAGGEQTDLYFEGEFSESTGLATSSACGIEGAELFVSNTSPSVVRAFGPPPQDFDPPCEPPPEVPPTIEDQYAVSVGTDGATVRAEINPNFWPDTRYFVQFGTGECSVGGCEEQRPVPPGLLLTDRVEKASLASAGIFLDGLEPDTTYSYRFVAQSTGGGPVFGIDPDGNGPEEASSEKGLEATFTTFPQPLPAKADCPKQIFRTGLAASLPDCRAYELVSPLDKNNGDIATDEVQFSSNPSNFQLAASDGTRATYSSFRAFGEPGGAPLLSQYLSSRDPETGWSSHSISPPRTSVPFFPALSSANSTQFKAFSEDLCNGWFIQDTDLALVPGAPPGVPNIYRRDDGECGEAGYGLITDEPPPGFPTPDEHVASDYAPTVQGISADSSRTLLRAAAALTPDACTTVGEGGRGIYQLYLHVPDSGGEGELLLVSVEPDGDPACVHSSGGTAQGEIGHFRQDSVHHALSDDASRVFWSTSGETTKATPFSGDGNQQGPLYVRLNPEGPQSASGECSDAEAGQACTIQISKKTTTRFWGADPAGTKALYTTDEGLFEFDVASESSEPITEADVEGVMGTSADLSRVYFVSTAVLSGEPNGEGNEAIAGQSNVYLRERGVAGFAFVGTLDDRDLQNAVSVKAPSSPVATLPDRRASRVSPDGLHVAFTSVAPLTGFDNTDVASGEPDAEVFLYDAVPGLGVGELACVSCNRSGVRPRGRLVAISGDNSPDLWHVARISGWQSQLRPTRPLSTDGDRLVFESFEALVLRDTNGKRDVYQWQRASSEAACEAVGAELFVEGAGGCISLISSGQSAENSDFLDASASGSDIFLFTASSLLPHDFGLVDVYDARVDGGFPPPPEPNVPCEGEACQPAPPPPPVQTPASSTFEGKGNVQSKPARQRCGKGKRRVTRGGKARCVKKQKRKGKRNPDRRAAR
jgi:hypothetical protein